MSGYVYFTGKYENYYNELNGIDIAQKSAALESEFQCSIQEFANVNSIINIWSGEAASAISTTNIPQIYSKFQEIGMSIENNLKPATQAMEELVPLLKNMKDKETLKINKEGQLQQEKQKDVPEKVRKGEKDDGSPNYVTNPAYNEWKQKIANLESEIKKLILELEEIKAQCDTKIEVIQSLEDAMSTFAQYSNSILGQGEIDFSNMTLEERLAYMDQIIANYQAVANQMLTYLQGIYGDDLNSLTVDAQDFERINFIFDAFDIYWKSGVKKEDLLIQEGTGQTVTLNISNLLTIMNYCTEKDVFTKVESYINGSSWEASGLSSLYDDQLFGYDENKFKDRLRQNYGITDATSYLKANYENIKTAYSNLSSAYSEYSELMQYRSFVNTKIEQLTNSKNLLPYEIYMENEDFMNYLNNNYLDYSMLSKENLQYMNQQEVALYDYLLNNCSKEKAEEYLKAMQDAINQRIGAYKAAEYANWLLQDGFQAVDLTNSGFEGLKDGVRGWWDGILDLGRVDSTEAGTKSAFDYEQLYKSQFIYQMASQYGITDSECSWINSFYQTGSSVGNMLVPMLASFIPVAGQALSSSLMFLSITGNSAVEAKQNGATTAQAYLYGGLTGAAELTTERLLGGIKGISNLKNLHIGNKALNGVTNYIANGLSEGFEEYTQSYIDGILGWAVLGDEYESVWDFVQTSNAEGLQAFGQGMITAGALNTINSGVSSALNVATNVVSQNFGTGVYDSTMQNSFAKFKNDIESRYSQPQLENALSKLATGENLSLIDNQKVSYMLKHSSAEEISNVTAKMTSQQQSNILNNSEVLWKDAKTNVQLSEVMNSLKANPTESVMQVSGVDIKTLHEEVTSDGRTLSEYLIDNSSNPENVINSVKEAGGLEATLTANKMQSRLQSNISEQIKYQNKVQQTVSSSESKISNYTTKLTQGESLTVFEKTDLNNAIKKVSVSELSDITSKLNTEQRSVLNNNTLSNTTMARVEASTVLQNAETSSAIPTDARILQRNVSRDGRNMAEYLVDKNPSAITESVINDVAKVNPTLATSIETRARERQASMSDILSKVQETAVNNNQTAQQTAAQATVQDSTQTAEVAKSSSDAVTTTSTMAVGAVGLGGLATSIGGVQQSVSSTETSSTGNTNGNTSIPSQTRTVETEVQAETRTNDSVETNANFNKKSLRTLFENAKKSVIRKTNNVLHKTRTYDTLIKSINDGTLDINSITANDLNLLEVVGDPEVSPANVLDVIKTNHKLYNELIEVAKGKPDVAMMILQKDITENIIPLLDVEIETNGRKLTGLDYLVETNPTAHIIQKLAERNVEIATKLIEQGDTGFLETASVEVLKQEVVKDGIQTTILDYALKNNVISKERINEIASKHIETATKLIEQGDTGFLETASVEVLKQEIVKDGVQTTILEYALKNDLISKERINEIVTSNEEVAPIVLKSGITPGVQLHKMIELKKELYEKGECDSPYLVIDSTTELDHIEQNKEIFDKESISGEDLILVRSTEYFPYDHTVLTANSGKAKSNDNAQMINGEKYLSSTFNRHTVHFSLNGLVTEGFLNAASWSTMPYIILEPFSHHASDTSFRGGFLGDSYFAADVKLSKDAVIMIEENYYKTEKPQIPEGYNIVLFKGNSSECTNSIINALGYKVIETNAYPQQYKELENKFDEYLRNNFKENALFDVGGLHSTSPYVTQERDYDKKQAYFEYLRNKPVNQNETFEITENEFMRLFEGYFIGDDISLKAGQRDYAKSKLDFYKDFNKHLYIDLYKYAGDKTTAKDRIANYIRKKGIKYDPNTGKYYSVGFDEWTSRYENISELEVNAIKERIEKYIENEIESLHNEQQHREEYYSKLKNKKSLRASILSDLYAKGFDAIYDSSTRSFHLTNRTTSATLTVSENMIEDYTDAQKSTMRTLEELGYNMEDFDIHLTVEETNSFFDKIREVQEIVSSISEGIQPNEELYNMKKQEVIDYIDSLSAKYGIERESSLTNSLENTLTNIDLSEAHVENLESQPFNENVNSYFSENTIDVIRAIEYAVGKYAEKYGKSKSSVVFIIDEIIQTGNFQKMTSYGDARNVLKKYSTTKLKEALDTMKKMTQVTPRTEADIRYCIEQLAARRNVSEELAIENIYSLVKKKDYKYMTRNGNARDIISKYSFEQIEAAINRIEFINIKNNRSQSQQRSNNILQGKDGISLSLFDNYGDSINDNYGVNQGLFYDMATFYVDNKGYTYREIKDYMKKLEKKGKVLPKTRKLVSQEYQDFKYSIMAKYGFTQKEASILLTCIDDVGACSYATVCNEIFNAFSGREAEFELAFGYPMFSETNGRKVLNSKWLLTDLYIFVNTTSNGGKFIISNGNGQLSLNPKLLNGSVDPLGRRLLNTEEQVYLEGSHDSRESKINGFMSSKGYAFKSTDIRKYKEKIDANQMKRLIDDIILGLKGNKHYRMSIFATGSNIRMESANPDLYSGDSTSRWKDGGHSIFITGVKNDSFIVSSWGKKYYIPFEDIMNGNCTIREDTIRKR